MIIDEENIIRNSIEDEVWEKLPIVKRIAILKKLGEILEVIRSEMPP